MITTGGGGGALGGGGGIPLIDTMTWETKKKIQYCTYSLGIACKSAFSITT